MNDPVTDEMLVLVVDYDVNAAAGLALELRRRAFRVMVARTHEEAMLLVFAAPPALAVVTSKLGDGSGVDLVYDLRARSNDTLIVVLAEKHETPMIVDAVRRGATKWITRPTTIDHILEVRSWQHPLKETNTPFETRAEHDRKHIRRVLEVCNWNLSRAADVLAIDRKTLQQCIDRYQLTTPQARQCRRATGGDQSA